MDENLGEYVNPENVNEEMKERKTNELIHLNQPVMKSTNEAPLSKYHKSGDKQGSYGDPDYETNSIFDEPKDLYVDYSQYDLYSKAGPDYVETADRIDERNSIIQQRGKLSSRDQAKKAPKEKTPDLEKEGEDDLQKKDDQYQPISPVVYSGKIIIDY